LVGQVLPYIIYKQIQSDYDLFSLVQWFFYEKGIDIEILPYIV